MTNTMTCLYRNSKTRTTVVGSRTKAKTCKVKTKIQKMGRIWADKSKLTRMEIKTSSKCQTVTVKPRICSWPQTVSSSQTVRWRVSMQTERR